MISKFLALRLIDKILLVFFTAYLILTITYFRWQFDQIYMLEDSMTKALKFFDVLEWIMFLVTRFVPFGKIGRFSLCGFYILVLTTLVFQFTFADRSFRRKHPAWKDIAWISYYVILIMVDIFNVPVLTLLFSRFSSFPAILEYFLVHPQIGKTIWLILFGLAKRFRGTHDIADSRSGGFGGSSRGGRFKG